MKNRYSFLSSQNCECIDEYYSQDNDPICKPCQHPCKHCKSLTTCTRKSKITSFFKKNKLFLILILLLYYYIILLLVCVSGENRNSFPSCSCKIGFLEDPNTKECIPCPLQCLTCNSRAECTSCKFGDSLQTATNTCLKCHPKCSHCSQNNINECYFCDNSA